MERKAYSFHPRAEKHIGKPDSIKRALCGTPFRMERNTPTLFRWQCGRTGDGEKRPQSRRRPAGRPTDLLLKRVPSPKPAAAGTVVFAAAVFMLLPGKSGKAAAGRSAGGGRRGGQDPGSERVGAGGEGRPAGAAAKPPERAEGPFHRCEAAMPCGADPDFAETGVTAAPGAAAPGAAGRSAGRPAGS